MIGSPLLLAVVCALTWLAAGAHEARGSGVRNPGPWWALASIGVSALLLMVFDAGWMALLVAQVALFFAIGMVRALALALPEATESPHFQYASFRVRGKIFATAPPAGDALHVFLAEAAREQALALHGAFVGKLLWGGKVVGVRVELARADAKVVGALLGLAWAAKAPKSLLAPGKR